MELDGIEICAGAGGQAIGQEAAGIKHVALVEIDKHACATLRANRPGWNVIQTDARLFDAEQYRGVALYSAGVPCPPFSVAGEQKGEDDERDLFPVALDHIDRIRPQVGFQLENVRGLFENFPEYRRRLTERATGLGYISFWALLNAKDFGVCQSRPRAVWVGLREKYASYFQWPPGRMNSLTVGDVLVGEMGRLGWERAEDWRAGAQGLAPTLVGGSKKHGGPDLGPTRARMAWAKLGVDGRGLADAPPTPGFEGMPRLTVPMAARIQGFPAEWIFAGGKTATYQQVGNAFPPPVAEAVARQIVRAFERGSAN